MTRSWSAALVGPWHPDEHPLWIAAAPSARVERILVFRRALISSSGRRSVQIGASSFHDHVALAAAHDVEAALGPITPVDARGSETA